MEVQPIYTPQDAVELQKHQSHLEYPGLTAYTEGSLCFLDTLSISAHE